MSTQYVSKQPDSKGYVQYTPEENNTWRELYKRQWEIVQNRGCPEYIQGIKNLGMSEDQIPQIPDINKRLQSLTGWSVAPVPALIEFEHFFQLIANKQFPAATFIRTPEDLDYIQEPDIFHEIFGHCPLLTIPAYADFMHKYAQIGLKATHKDRVMLARLYWFTVEFGLMNTAAGLRIYGGGILSSIGETPYALESDIPKRVPLITLEAFRTPYRIDIFQPIYFIINDFAELFHLLDEDLLDTIQKARELGMYPPAFPPKTSLRA